MDDSTSALKNRSQTNDVKQQQSLTVKDLDVAELERRLELASTAVECECILNRR